MKKLALVCLMSMFLVACSKDQHTEPAPAAAAKAEPTKPSYFAESKESITATVTAIDQPTRMVTLRGPQGNELIFRADEEVRNLPQVQVGDEVKVDYYESMAVHVRKPGEPINDVRTALDRAEPGEKPGGMAAQHITVTATVEAIDTVTPAVVLRGPGGRLKTVRIRDPKKLENVKVGDQVVATYTESLAVGVTKVK